MMRCWYDWDGQISWESIEGKKEKEKISEQAMDKWSRVWPTGRHAFEYITGFNAEEMHKGDWPFRFDTHKINPSAPERSICAFPA